jgi:hypothetical protein
LRWSSVPLSTTSQKTCPMKSYSPRSCPDQKMFPCNFILEDVCVCVCVRWSFLDRRTFWCSSTWHWDPCRIGCDANVYHFFPVLRNTQNLLTEIWDSYDAQDLYCGVLGIGTTDLLEGIIVPDYTGCHCSEDHPMKISVQYHRHTHIYIYTLVLCWELFFKW